MRPSPASETAITTAARWVLRGGIFLLPLAYTWDTYDGYVLPKLVLARGLVAALALLLVLRALAGGGLAIRRTPLDWPLAAFVASAALSSVFAFNSNVALFGTYARYDGLLTTLTYAALFWLAVQVVDSRDEARTVLRVLVAAGYVASLVAIVQVAHDSLAQGSFVAAYGSLGQKNVLGGFLAMVVPIALYELVDAKRWSAVLLSANASVAVLTALVLTFSRSAWIAGGVAVAVLAIWMVRARIVRAHATRLGATAVLALSVSVLVLVSLVHGTGASSVRDDLASPGDRPAVWADSLRLIASRPLIGYGPDNFGLVFPNFQSERLRQSWDKAHAEVLQIAATQGVVGVAAYGAMLIAFGIGFWRGRASPGAAAAFAALLAYEASLQVNFTALASAFPFWILGACAFELWGQARERHVIAVEHRWRFAPVAAAAAAAAAIVAVAGVVNPYLADRHLLSAVAADYSGHSNSAVADAAAAYHLNGNVSVYAVEVGNIAFERGDWHGAVLAYTAAAEAGTYDPMVYRNLSLAYSRLGMVADARSAARDAYALDRFDPANRALLAQFVGPVV